MTRQISWYHSKPSNHHGDHNRLNIPQSLYFSPLAQVLICFNLLLFLLCISGISRYSYVIIIHLYLSIITMSGLSSLYQFVYCNPKAACHHYSQSLFSQFVVTALALRFQYMFSWDVPVNSCNFVPMTVIHLRHLAASVPSFSPHILQSGDTSCFSMNANESSSLSSFRTASSHPRSADNWLILPLCPTCILLCIFLGLSTEISSKTAVVRNCQPEICLAVF